MKSCVVLESPPLVAKVIVPLLLLCFTGSSGNFLSFHFAFSAGSELIPHCAMNPGMTLKNLLAS